MKVIRRKHCVVKLHGFFEFAVVITSQSSRGGAALFFASLSQLFQGSEFITVVFYSRRLSPVDVSSTTTSTNSSTATTKATTTITTPGLSRVESSVLISPLLPPPVAASSSI